MPKETKSKNGRKTTKAIPYARGFRRPTCSEQESAAGFNGNVPIQFANNDSCEDKFFSSIPKPTSIDDWLAQYVERGQSYSQFIRENPWLSSRKQIRMRQNFVSSGSNIREKYPDGKIYVAKIGNFKSNDVCFEDLLDYIEKFLNLPVAAMSGLNIENKDGQLFFIEDPSVGPKRQREGRKRRSLLHTRKNDKTGHVQICVDSILPKMRLVVPEDALCLVGLTQYDLYGDNTDLFVAGMASGNDHVAVFSLLRYNPTLSFSQEFWYDIQDESTKMNADEKRKLTLKRSCKLVVHEICHLLGVDHCIYYNCCMNGSGHLQEDFAQTMMLCPVDLRKLHKLIGFNIEDRYNNLHQFYQKHSLTEEANWIEGRLKFIKDS